MELLERIRELLRTFPQVGMSGRLTIRIVDEDVFLDGVKKILEEHTRRAEHTENPV